MSDAPLGTKLNFDADFSWERFQTFCLELALALDDVVDAHQYGIHGEDQSGIDIHADLADGRVRSIQCRRVKRFGKSEAVKTMAETSYEADEHHIWATCAITRPGQDTVDGAPGWTIWGADRITSEVRTLKPEVGRTLIETHLGASERRRVLGPGGNLLTGPASMLFRERDALSGVIRSDQPLVGREQELKQLKLAAEADATKVVILPGRGGIGKTRLLRAFAESNPNRRILLVRDAAAQHENLPGELPLEPFDLVVDDVHRASDLHVLLSAALGSPGLGTLVLGVRPHGLSALRGDLATIGLLATAVHVCAPLTSLSDQEATELAEFELRDTGPDTLQYANRLGALTADAPAVLVIAADLMRTAAVVPDALVADPRFRQQVLARFRDERIGNVDQKVDPGVAQRVLRLCAAIAPADGTSTALRGLLATAVGGTEDEVAKAISALQAADLLSGANRRLRVSPDVLADQLLYEAASEAAPAGNFVRHLVAWAPDALLSNVLVNLAEVDWRLGQAGEPTILGPALGVLRDRLLAAGAWDRSQQLERIERAAPFISEWVVRVARELVDDPARDEALFGSHVVSNGDVLETLTRLLAAAGLNPSSRPAALRLLWEIGRDQLARRHFRDEEAIARAAQLTNYRRPLAAAEDLIELVEGLISQLDGSEPFARLPVELLSELVKREVDTAEAISRKQFSLGSFHVDAERAEPVRLRVRAVLSASVASGGQRSRTAAARLLDRMLDQPRGRFGQRIPDAALKQWRREQLELVRMVGRLLRGTQDGVAAWTLRSSLEWHAEHSAIHGVKSEARRQLKASTRSTDEQLVDAMIGGLFRLPDRAAIDRRGIEAVRALVTEEEGPSEIVSRIDGLIEHLAVCRADLHRVPGALLSALARVDVETAADVCDLLVEAPTRPTASGLGTLVSALEILAPDRVESLIPRLAVSTELVHRRHAANYMSEMRWEADPLAEERSLVIALAKDEDSSVLHAVVLAAHRIRSADPELAAAIVRSVERFDDTQVVEDLCMVAAGGLPFDTSEWTQFLNRLLTCPEMGYWYRKLLTTISSSEIELVVEHLFARLAVKAVGFGHDLDEIETDLFANHRSQRTAALDRVLRLLAAEDFAGPRPTAATDLFWLFARGHDDVAIATISTALAGDERIHEAALHVLADSSEVLLLLRPDQVALWLDESAAGAPLKRLQGALRQSLQPMTLHGSPGEPYVEEMRLHSAARHYRTESVPGSRAEGFWQTVVDSMTRNMQRAVEEDEAEAD